MDLREFAKWAHGDQKYGDEPYVTHLDEVATIACGLVVDAAARVLVAMVAYLHDTIEDTPVNERFLADHFDWSAAKAVSLVTDPPGINRRLRKAALHARLSVVDETDRVGRAALLVKVADRLANVRSCLRVTNKTSLLKMYASEHEDFRFAVYREGMCDEAWRELDKLLVSSNG